LRALNPKRFSFRVFATPILSLRSDRRPLQTAPSPICKPARIGIVTSFVGAAFGARPLESRVASLNMAEFVFEPAPCALDQTTANQERELKVGTSARVGPFRDRRADALRGASHDRRPKTTRVKGNRATIAAKFDKRPAHDTLGFASVRGEARRPSNAPWRCCECSFRKRCRAACTRCVVSCCWRD
jgi:hypothetical protein